MQGQCGECNCPASQGVIGRGASINIRSCIQLVIVAIVMSQSVIERCIFCTCIALFYAIVVIAAGSPSPIELLGKTNHNVIRIQRIPKRPSVVCILPALAHLLSQLQFPPSQIYGKTGEGRRRSPCHNHIIGECQKQDRSFFFFFFPQEPTGITKGSALVSSVQRHTTLHGGRKGEMK